MDENLFYHGTSFEKREAERLVEECAKAGIDAMYVGQDVPGNFQFYEANPDYKKDVEVKLRGCERARDNKEYKKCLNDWLMYHESARYTAGRNRGKRIPLKKAGCPPQGTSDVSIREWAESEGRIIISSDLGRELESKTKIDRVAIRDVNPRTLSVHMIKERLAPFCDCSNLC